MFQEAWGTLEPQSPSEDWAHPTFASCFCLDPFTGTFAHHAEFQKMT